ncbi:MAG: hypothetical protein HY078_13005 [Elusimicrobia bacterium]|nr:hypothetical protein [Elusimicrobiota bacterium]
MGRDRALLLSLAAVLAALRPQTASATPHGYEEDQQHRMVQAWTSDPAKSEKLLAFGRERGYFDSLESFNALPFDARLEAARRTDLIDRYAATTAHLERLERVGVPAETFRRISWRGMLEALGRADLSETYLASPEHVSKLALIKVAPEDFRKLNTIQMKAALERSETAFAERQALQATRIGRTQLQVQDFLGGLSERVFGR